MPIRSRSSSAGSGRAGSADPGARGAQHCAGDRAGRACRRARGAAAGDAERPCDRRRRRLPRRDRGRAAAGERWLARDLRHRPAGARHRLWLYPHRRGAADGVRRVERFVEKPDRATAEAYLAEGCYAWNGGIFLFRADAYLAALDAHAPAIARRRAPRSRQREARGADLPRRSRLRRLAIGIRSTMR